jgi:hypothetical protein
MSATSLDLSQIKTDALSAASSFRTLIGLGTLATQSGTFSGTSSGTNTGDQDLSGLVVGPASATNNAIALFDTTTGKLLKNSTFNVDASDGALRLGSTYVASDNGNGSIGTRLRMAYDSGSTGNIFAFGRRDGAYAAQYYTGGGTTTGFRALLGALDVPVGYIINSETIITSDAAQTLAQRNAGNAQRFNLYGTFTNSSNYERMFLEYNTTGTAYRIGTEKAGTGSARALELQTDGTTRLTIGTTGLATFTSDVWTSGDFRVSSTKYFYWQSRSTIRSPADGLICLANAAENDFGRIQLGGTTSSFPAIKRNAAALNFRLADDSADCDITAAALTLSGNLTISTKNIVTDTTTGTKIGTGTTQKLGFFNATPVVQPTAVADATDAASVITQLNALLSRMRTLGLIAT